MHKVTLGVLYGIVLLALVAAAATGCQFLKDQGEKHGLFVEMTDPETGKKFYVLTEKGRRTLQTGSSVAGGLLSNVTGVDLSGTIENLTLLLLSWMGIKKSAAGVKAMREKKRNGEPTPSP